MLRKMLLLTSLLLSQSHAFASNVNDSVPAQLLREDRAQFVTLLENCGRGESGIDYKLLDDTNNFTQLHIFNMMADKTMLVGSASSDYVRGQMNLSTMAESIAAFKFFGEYGEIYKQSVTDNNFLITNIGRDEWNVAYKNARHIFENSGNLKQLCSDTAKKYRGYTNSARDLGMIK